MKGSKGRNLRWEPGSRSWNRVHGECCLLFALHGLLRLFLYRTQDYMFRGGTWGELGPSMTVINWETCLQTDLVEAFFSYLKFPPPWWHELVSCWQNLSSSSQFCCISRWLSVALSSLAVREQAPQSSPLSCVFPENWPVHFTMGKGLHPSFLSG